MRSTPRWVRGGSSRSRPLPTRSSADLLRPTLTYSDLLRLKATRTVGGGDGDVRATWRALAYRDRRRGRPRGNGRTTLAIVRRDPRCCCCGLAGISAARPLRARPTTSSATGVSVVITAAAAVLVTRPRQVHNTRSAIRPPPTPTPTAARSLTGLARAPRRHMRPTVGTCQASTSTPTRALSDPHPPLRTPPRRVASPACQSSSFLPPPMVACVCGRPARLRPAAARRHA